MVFGALVFKFSVWCGAEGYVLGLRAAAVKLQTGHISYKIGNTEVNNRRDILQFRLEGSGTFSVTFDYDNILMRPFFSI